MELHTVESFRQSQGFGETGTLRVRLRVVSSSSARTFYTAKGGEGRVQARVMANARVRIK
jgi:hypothetical protein